MKDHYQVLGISRSATEAEIKIAYRKIVKEHHPDLHRGDPDALFRFLELQIAYEVLSDPEKRAVYDRKNGEPNEQARTGVGEQEQKTASFWEWLHGVSGVFKRVGYPEGRSLEARLMFLELMAAITCAHLGYSELFEFLMKNWPCVPVEPASIDQGKESWRRLQVGMSQQQVKGSLGEPYRVDLNEVFRTVVWVYSTEGSAPILHTAPPAGSVKFDYDRGLVSWKEPLWSTEHLGR